MRIVSVVGARPEFIQAMPVSRAVRAQHQEILVHTGQHYDYQMSQTFFNELDIPAPDYNLGVGSASQARQTAEIMVGLEDVLLKEAPDFVLVRGDTNSSLAAALAASKLNIPFAHIEAGERSFNRRMPEETNRIVVDRLADVHFCVSQAAVRHLDAEGIRTSVHQVGDVMLDAILSALPLARRKSKILEQLQLTPRQYALVTIHRAENTDHPAHLAQLIAAFNQVQETVIFPVHPRTRKALAALELRPGEHIRLVEPLGYLDMIALEENARLIATDSGGVQREAYYVKVPCLTLRRQTEWVATVETGWNRLVGTDPQVILDNWFNFTPPAEPANAMGEAHGGAYGNGTAARRIAEILNAWAADETERGTDLK